ncbi:protease Do [Thermodesulfatator indicus DSM 15286]|uniref:Probable periplasmic serine endoprotease DegP-like n=1 Tax=Thermodesulfatator indicus (strain DSM 15286 / JCM 11887 / CIR29812) TaxID=667014 RepID=F8A8R5_THEID|nr:DegQ family serine endoprotease [Thermodesulfatator indicus]AEH44896.1 protease Do [Thermodesulfatator indicus DSM 15286]
MRSKIGVILLFFVFLANVNANASVFEEIFKVKRTEENKAVTTQNKVQDQEAINLAIKLSHAFAQVAKKAGPAVVFVQVEKVIVKQGPAMEPFPFGSPFDFFGPDFFERFFRERFPHKYKQMAAGSGFIISKDGYIITNNHVVANADKVTVKLADGREFKAKIVGTDPASDVAVLKIKADNLPVLPLGDSDKIQVGEWVIAIGNPFGLTQTVTVGVISAKGRSGMGITDYEDFIQTDAAINPGNSGGPLVNLRGEAIGMNTAIFTRSGGYMGIGFAIPINMVKVIAKQLIEKGKVVRGWLGVVIQDLNEDLAKSFGLEKPEGALVTDVAPNSPADKAGLKPGDIIVEYNGKPVKNVAELRTLVALTSPGTKVKMVVFRKGHKKELEVVIGSQPQSFSILTGQNELLQKLGLEVKPLTPALAEQLGYGVNEGVVITGVAPGSPADIAGLRPGMLIEEVNHRRVHNLKEFVEALALSKKTGIVLFLVRDKEFRRYVSIRLR